MFELSVQDQGEEEMSFGFEDKVGLSFLLIAGIQVAQTYLLLSLVLEKQDKKVKE